MSFLLIRNIVQLDVLYCRLSGFRFLLSYRDGARNLKFSLSHFFFFYVYWNSRSHLGDLVFQLRLDKVANFLKVAESVGIDRTEIPDLTRAPASLLEALEAHLIHLEGGKAPPSIHHVIFFDILSLQEIILYC